MKDEFKNYKIVFNYVEKIKSGQKIACKNTVMGCERFLNDLKKPEYDFRPAAAEFVIQLIETTFRHQQGECIDGTPLRGTPFLLEPFHKFIVYNLLGFYHKGTGITRFHEAFIFIPRKNIKTTFAGALAWALGVLRRMSGSKIYVVAAALKQTMESFGFVKYNVLREDDEGELRIIDNNNEHSISGEIAGGMIDFQALATNPDSQDSFNCNAAIADEIHAFKKAKQYSLFKDAMKAYTNKLMIGITTAGDNVNTFCYGHLQYCKKVLQGTIEDEQMFIFIAEADPDANGEIDYTNPLIHEMANPAYRVSIRPDEILNDSVQAQNDPQKRKDFFAKSLNVYTAAMKAYFDINKVQKSDECYNWSLEELEKLPIKWYGGADLSKLHDLSGAALHGRYNGIDIAITHGFIPVVTAQIKADEDNIPFFWWKEKGWLTLCNSPTIEYEDVVKWFIRMRNMGFKIKTVGYDRRFSSEFVLKMKKARFKIVDQPQRYVEKTEPFRNNENQIIKQKFYYVHNKAYEYCIGNVWAIEDSDDFVRFQKVEKTQRIDLFDADVIACKQMLKDIERSGNAEEWRE